MSIYPIEIYRDEQAGVEPGWAWRDNREGSPLGSGAVDGDAASALDSIISGEELLPCEREALAELIDSEICCPRALVGMEPIGDLYGAETVDDSLPPGLTPESAFHACDGPREQRKQDLADIAKEAQDWADTWGSSAAQALADEAWEYLGD